MQVFSNVLEMVGRTPMLEVTNIDTGPCRLFLKLELANPGGSIKDRIGISMIDEAEKRGDLNPGDTIVEATAGNTGLGLALVAQQKGYSLILVLPDKMSHEKIFNLRAMGAEVILHPTLTSSIDRDAEIAMIRAHAAMNQLYFFDVNVSGPLGVGQSCVAGPGGEVIYQAYKGREIIALKLDFDYLHEVRKNGWQNLGQPLKSFRDSKVKFPQYTEGYASEALKALGPMHMASGGNGAKRSNDR